MAPSYDKTWDETKPSGDRARSLGDDDIREGKYAVRERLAQDHCFYDDETDEVDVGYHKKCTMMVRDDDETSVANAIILYGKDVDSVCELHAIDESDNVIQITSGGYIKKASIEDSAFVPTGAILAWAGTIATIPTGWAICDGAGGTPNLMNKFLYGVPNGSTNPGTTGGASTHTHAAGTLTGPSHTHSVGAVVPGGSEQASAGPPGILGDQGEHTHGNTGAGGTGTCGGSTASGSSLPPYYEMAWIRKS